MLAFLRCLRYSISVIDVRVYRNILFPTQQNWAYTPFVFHSISVVRNYSANHVANMAYGIGLSLWTPYTVGCSKIISKVNWNENNVKNHSLLWQLPLIWMLIYIISSVHKFTNFHVWKEIFHVALGIIQKTGYSVGENSTIMIPYKLRIVYNNIFVC